MSSVEESAALKKVAEGVRKKWIASLNAGEVDIRTLTAYSKLDDEHKYLSTIRLITILVARPDWTKATALEVLQRHGFNDKTSIRTLRGAPVQLEAFETILKTAASRWRARTAPQEGWPFRGKLAVLVSQAGAELPDELASLMDEEDDYQDDIETQEFVNKEIGAALLDLLNE